MTAASMTSAGKRSVPELSIVIPVYNEEAILRQSVLDLCAGLSAMNRSFEIILAENGSSDRTVTVGQALARERPEVVMFSCQEPNYGRALREGIGRARGDIVICDEIDLCDLDFYRRALALLERDNPGHVDMVVGSKAMKGACDARPLLRRVATRAVNGMLRVAVGFRGTDTHGLKAFRRERLLPIVQACVIDKDLFASELVIRAGRAHRGVVEIPVVVAEKRPPAINLVRRVPRVLRDLVKLTVAIRRRG